MYTKFLKESYNQSAIKHKSGLLNLGAESRDLSNDYSILRFVMGTFYQYQAARNAGGLRALFEVSRRKPNLKTGYKSARAVKVASVFPAHGQVRASNDLQKQGVYVSPSGVRSIWLLHDLPSTKQRLTALEKMSAD